MRRALGDDHCDCSGSFVQVHSSPDDEDDADSVDLRATAAATPDRLGGDDGGETPRLEATNFRQQWLRTVVKPRAVRMQR